MASTPTKYSIPPPPPPMFSHAIPNRATQSGSLPTTGISVSNNTPAIYVPEHVGMHHPGNIHVDDTPPQYPYLQHYNATNKGKEDNITHPSIRPATLASKHISTRVPEPALTPMQHHEEIIHHSTDPNLTASQKERERASEDAILRSLQHTVEHYVRQNICKELGVDEDGEPLHYQDCTNTKPLEFHPGTPQHNIPIMSVLLVTFFSLLPMLGSLTLTVGLLGSAAVYIADYLGYRKGSILVMLVSLTAFEAALLVTNIRHVFNSTGALLAMINTFIVAGCLTSIAILQYRWMQTTFPELVVFLERSVLCVTPLAAIPALFSSCIALAGSRMGIFPFVVCMCGLQYIFAGKRYSSFLRVSDTSGVTNSEGDDIHVTANGKEDAALLTLITMFVSPVCFLALQSNITMEPAMVTVTVSGLLGISSLHLLHQPEVTLWFMRPAQRTTIGQLKTDPLGLWPFIIKHRPLVLFVGYTISMEAGVYRLLHSRFQYLFTGLPKPFNGLVLMAIGFLITVIVSLIFRSLKSADRGGNESSPRTMDRIVIMVLSMIAAVSLAFVADMPIIFHSLSALSVTSFNAYLLDRRNGTNFSLFLLSSSFCLMWWMYRTFSFIVMDLRILTDGTVIPTSALTGSVLLCYLLGALSFGLSFSTNKTSMAICFFILSLKVAFVEHILYSQREAGVYPGALVFLTSGVGVWACFRMYNNKIMTPGAVAVISSSFVAKIYTFLCEQTGAQYLLDSEENTLDGLRGLFISLGWVCAFAATTVVAILEMEEIENKRTRNPEHKILIFALFTFTAMVFAHRSLVRAFTESLLFSYDTIANELDAIIGSTLLITTVCVFAVMMRYCPHRNSFKDCLVPFAVSLAFVFCHPFAILSSHSIDNDDDEGISYDTTPYGRIIAFLAFSCILIARYVPFHNAPTIVRYLYWSFICALIACALHLVMLPASSYVFALMIFIFVTLTGVLIDMAHYRHEIGLELWIIFGVSVGAMILSFITIGHLDIAASIGTVNTPLLLQIHDNTRMTLLSIGSVANMLLAILIKFRLSGNPLLPSPLPMTEDTVQYIGVVGNYATLMSTCMMIILNAWAGDGNIPMYIFISTFLLILVDDGILFSHFGHGTYRYFPVLLSILVSLWGTLLYEAYVTYTVTESISDALGVVAYSIAVLPSHLSLLRLLYHGGSKKGGLPMNKILLFIVIDFWCILFTNNIAVQWMAIVGITGQFMRLYAAQFWTQSVTTVI